MLKFLLMLMIIFLPCIGKAQALLMHGKKEGSGVESYPFHGLPVWPVLAGEVGNSSASRLSYMSGIWKKAKAMHFNTVLVPVYWELLEPAEGNFDFMLVDSLIYQARANDLHLVLLWFGSWKNSMSCYAPAWVKKDVKRFPRAGTALEILSAFEENNVQADIRAFTALMKRVKQLDAKERTVLMIQVENEIGMPGAPREYTAVANEAYAGPVPDALMRYLIAHKDDLVPELRRHWGGQGYRTSGSWETVFGKSMATEELFQAWYYAVYTDRVAGAGKAVYMGNGEVDGSGVSSGQAGAASKRMNNGRVAFGREEVKPGRVASESGKVKPGRVASGSEEVKPGQVASGSKEVNPGKVGSGSKVVPPLLFFVNAALNYRHVQPGAYPSGGPLPHLMDIWQAAAPNIDILSPDFYNPFFKEYNDLYTRQHNPLFIPEIRFEPSDAVKVFYAVGHYKAIGFSPFSFESTDHAAEEPLGKSYSLLEQLGPLLYKYPMEGILPDSSIPQEIQMGKYTFTVSHEATLGWTAFKDWPLSGGIIIQTGEDDFIVAGTGIVLTVKNAGILQAEEGVFDNGQWRPGRRLNGDQTHQGRHIRIPSHNWEIQKVSFYRY